jgi:hypothetical protein
MACWHEKLQDYNFKIVHVAGKENGLADALSRMHQDKEKEQPKLMPLISPDRFLNMFEAGDLGTLEHKVIQKQQEHEATMRQWEKTILITPERGIHETR